MHYTLPPLNSTFVPAPARRQPAFCARLNVVRGDYVENSFDVVGMVVSNTGKITHALSDSENFVFPLRSAAKPIQALPAIQLMQAGKIKLSSKEIAAICSSHWGTPKVINVLDNLLKRFQLSEADLQCGTHPPTDAASRDALIRSGTKTNQLHHQCAGNHAGVIISAKINQMDTDSYLSPNHPINKQILNHLSTIAETNDIKLGTEQCGMPAYALNIKNAGLAYAKLVSDARYKPIVKAMTAHPDIISTNGIDRWLMEITNGRLISKVGANGTVCVGNTKTKEGCVLRVVNRAEDVNQRAIIKLLAEIKWLTPGEHRALVKKFPTTTHNDRGKPIGTYQIENLSWEKPPQLNVSG